MPRALLLVMAMLVASATTIRAQGGGPPQGTGGGGVQPMAGGGGGGGEGEPDETPPTITLQAPTGPVTTSNPLIQILWCDNAGLWAASRQIKVNGVAQTASFSYSLMGSQPPGCTAKYLSGTTSVALNLGSNTVWAYICDGSNNCSQETFTIYRSEGPPPTVSLAPHSADFVDYGRCAAGCFTARYAHATVPYVSSDAPRNVALIYNGNTVRPRPFVHVDVTNGGVTPQYYLMRVRRAGQDLKFVNGETTLRFAGTSGTVRLGAQLDADTNGLSVSGAYAVSVIVGAQYANTYLETTVNTRLLVLRDLPLAQGWNLAGLQSLFLVGDSAVIYDGDGSLLYFQRSGSTSFTSPAGDFSRLTVSGSGSGTTYIRAYPDSTKVTFNYVGRMVRVTDAWGNVAPYEWDAQNRLIRVKDPSDTLRYIRFVYAANGWLDSIVDPFKRATDVSVTAGGALTAIMDPDGLSTLFTYDSTLRLTRVTNRAGVAVSDLFYHPQSRLVVADSGPSIAVYPSGTARPATSYVPWQHGGVPYAATSDTAFAPPRADTVRATVTDAGGHAVRFTVNQRGLPLIVTGFNNDTVTMRYTSAFLVDSIRPNRGVGGGYTFNASGLPTRVTEWHRTTNLTYAAFGRVDSTFGETIPTRDSIGANGRVSWTRVAGQYGYPTLRTSYFYDSRGRVDSIKDPSNHVLSRNWYAGMNGNLSRVSAPGRADLILLYDSLGRRVADSVVGRQRTNLVTYDVLNRVTEARDTASATPTRYYYGPLALDSLKDPAGNVYRWTRNVLGWVTASTDPLLATQTAAYDVEGQLRRTVNRRGDTILMTYDGAHRLTLRSGPGIADTTTYSADERVVTVANPSSRITTYLNGNWRDVDSVRTVLNIPGAGSQTYVHRYTYLNSGIRKGQVDSAWTTASSASFLGRRYRYNPWGALDTIRVGGAATYFSWDGDRLPTTIRMPGDSIRTTWSNAHHAATMQSMVLGNDYGFFDDLGRLTQHGQSTYTYDIGGRMTRRGYGETTQCFSMADGGIECEYLIDSLRTFAYDAMGNRTLTRAQLPDSTVLWSRSGSYGTGNRMASFAGCNYANDADGNVTQRYCASGDSVRFGWSADGRLRYFRRVGGDSVSFAYDPLGRVVRRDIGSSVASNFLWEGDNLFAELGAAGTYRVGQYSYYPGLDRLHSFTSGQGTFRNYGHQDVEGNVRGLTHNEAWGPGVSVTYSYDEFGDSVGGGADYLLGGVDRARWKGSLYLGGEAGLYFMRNRWYETRTGRFLSEDPIGLAGGLNLYAFAGADPIGGSDPLGLDPDCEFYNIWVVSELYVVDQGGRYGPYDRRIIASYRCPSSTRVARSSAFRPHGGGGGGNGNSGSPQRIYNSDRACGAELVNLGANLLVDGVATAAGLGGGALLARGALNLAAGGLVRAGTASIVAPTMTTMQRGVLGAAGRRAMAAGAREASMGGAVAVIGNVPNAADSPASGFSLADLIPFRGSFLALMDVVECYRSR